MSLATGDCRQHWSWPPLLLTENNYRDIQSSPPLITQLTIRTVDKDGNVKKFVYDHGVSSRFEQVEADVGSGLLCG